MIETLRNLDVRLLLYLNSHNSPFFDKLMFFISGVLQWIPLYLFLIFWIFYKFRKKGWVIFLLTILVFALSDAGSVHLFKNVFLRLRPSHNPEIQGMLHLVNGYHGGLYGFISSHAANTFGLAVIMCLVFQNRWMTLGMLIWASVVSYSRIYLGVHYPFDVIGGALWGSLMATFVYLTYRWLLKNRDSRQE